jgi:FAD/FMN-containing dehydrogenase
VRFAQAHNLKVAIKASGHDFLGRSTAKNSLLLWTRYLQNITFHDSFSVGGKAMGSAVTVGSGVGLRTLYQATKAQGKVFVGGTAETVVAAGGYVQGAGHSALGPLFGLAADNALGMAYRIVLGALLILRHRVSNRPC